MARRVERESGPGIEKLYNLKAAADLLGVSPWTVRRWGQRSMIPVVRLGGRMMVAESTLRALIQKGTKAASAPQSARLV